MSDIVPILEEEPAPPRIEAARGDLTSGPVAKTLLMFTLPTLGANVLQSLNGSISAIYVGKFLGENAFAAAGIATFVMFVIFSSVFGLGMSTTILIGQAMGRGDVDEVRRTIGATAGSFIGIGVIMGLFGNWIAPPILHAMATPAAAMPFAVSFLHVVFLGVPLVFLTVLLQSALRGIGDAVTPLWNTVLNLVLSLVLNPLFILGWGPIPKMGLPGAAFAGVLTNFFCLAFMLWRIYALDLTIRLRGRELALLKPDWEHMKPVLVMGVPMGLSMVVMSIAGLVMMGLINREGVDTAAAYNAVNQMYGYIQMPAFAVGSAVSAMAAQNIGAGRWDRIGLITRTGVMTNIIMTGVLVLLVTLAAHPLLGLFLPASSNAIPIGEHINLLIGWTFVPMGISMVLTSTVRANGAVVVPFAIMFFSIIIVRMSVGFGLYPRYGADAIWWSFMASGSTSALLGIAYYLQGSWRKSGRAMARPAPVPAE